MANGTIAFDTLQTSGQITGTAKSVDTDYVVNGSAKGWVHGNMTGTAVVEESFNFGSLTDAGTGNMQVAYTNNMASAYYIFTTFFNNSVSNNGSNLKAAQPTLSTSQIDVLKFENNTATDCAIWGCALHGDLA